MREDRAMADLPTSARAVVIGGGIVGCSTAYHLAKLGWTDTVLVEKHKLTSGSTFHAAGLVGQLRTSANITQLLGNSVELYKTLEAETGQATGWKMNGGLRLACNEERWTEVKRQATTAKSFGLEMHLLTPREAQELWPLMQVDDLVGAAFLPTDGQANPSDITMALARGARMAGATLCEDTEVLSIEVVDGVVRAVVTDQGRIECEKVVVCAGQWTRDLAATVGVAVPLVSVEHQYVITEQFTPEVPRTLPTLRDPDRLTYYKEEVGGLVMGGYEPNPKSWAEGGVPEDFAFRLLDELWVRLLIGSIAVMFGAQDLLREFFGRRARVPEAPDWPKGVFWSSVSGVTSFIANAGGPPLQVYLQPYRMDKTAFVATISVFFWVINWLKFFPFVHLGLFTFENLGTSAVLLPLAALGMWLGFWMHARVDQKRFYLWCNLFLFLTGWKLVYDGIAGLFFG